MRYAKTCRCTSLRNGIIIIGVIDVLLAALALGFAASGLYSPQSAEGKNKTQSVGSKSDNDGGDIHVNALIGVIAQTITIIVAVSLIVVAAIHRAKFQRLLLVWLGWTIVALLITVVLMIVGIVVFKSTFVDIALSLVSIGYMIVSFWLVLSYYKFFAASGDRQI